MDAFETHRPLLFSIAYRMLGSAMEAEDIVQETYLRYQAIPPEDVRSPKAFLSTVVTRLCLDHLKSAQHQRESYIGPWLPEPLLTDPMPTPPKRYIEYESISMAFLVLLESLNPAERAVFLLRDVFDYDYAEIGEIVNRTEIACRQLCSRARRHIAEHRPRYQSTPEEHRQMVSRFMEVVEAGDLDGLVSLLAEDVSHYADGGGKAQAALRPIVGRDHVARYFIGLRRFIPADARVEVTDVNTRPAIVMRLPDGKAFTVIMFTLRDGLIHDIHAILNPDKLTHI